MYCCSDAFSKHLELAARVQCSVSVSKFNYSRYIVFETTHPVRFFPPGASLSPSTCSPTRTRFGSLSLPMRATNPAKSILRFRTVVSTFSQASQPCRARLRVVVVIVVVLILTHRHNNAARGRRTGSNNSGVEEIPR